MLTSFLVIGATLLPAADTARTISAHRLTPDQSAPVIDGRLDDAVWASAPVATDFVQQRPTPGAAPTQRTEARFVYDDNAIYVAVRAFDTEPDAIAAELGRRDATGLHSDWVHVVFDSYHDRRTGYRFVVNPRGVKRDVFHFNDGPEDAGWDAVWEVATTVDSLGWTAEFRIPFSQLRYRPSAGEQTWGLNVIRDIARLDERSYWSPMPPGQPGFASRFGTLEGLVGLRSPRALEVLPYTVASVTRAPEDAGNPFYRENAARAGVGADVKYGLTSDFTLTATINPDFGQVEADPSQVNLSAFETFLPERRPFFVEGMDIFRFGLGGGDGGDFAAEALFYPRRIGRAPQGAGQRIPGNAPYRDVPTTTRILGAGKLSGKTPDGWSVGILNAFTGREQARFFSAAGEEHRLAVEPLTSYGVARVSRDLNAGRTAFGTILTTTHRRLDAADSLAFLPSAAYAGGFDARHRFGPGGGYSASGWILASAVQGDSFAMRRLQRSPARYFHRPDAGHLSFDPGATSLRGWAASGEVMKTSGNWNGGTIMNVRSPGFEANDLGYQREADQVFNAAFVGYRRFTPGTTFRSWSVFSNVWTVHTFARERNALGGNVNGNFTLNSLWGGYGGIARELPRTATRALRGGPAIEVPGGLNGWAGLNTDRRKNVSGSLNTWFGREDGTGGYNVGLGSGVTWRAGGQAQLTLNPSYSVNRSAWQFAASRSLDGRPHYAFARLDQRTAALTARLNYTFAPNLSLQVYGQPFISAGDASDFRLVRLTEDGTAVAPAATFADRFRPVAPEDADRVQVFDPSFNVMQFRSNAVMRWEYRPGSTLFVVWQQGRQDFQPDGSFDLGRDARRLFGFDPAHPVPSTNVLMIKANYWLNF
jgi:hypothetical protein